MTNHPLVAEGQKWFMQLSMRAPSPRLAVEFARGDFASKNAQAACEVAGGGRILATMCHLAALHEQLQHLQELFKMQQVERVESLKSFVGFRSRLGLTVSRHVEVIGSRFGSHEGVPVNAIIVASYAFHAQLELHLCCTRIERTMQPHLAQAPPMSSSSSTKLTIYYDTIARDILFGGVLDLRKHGVVYRKGKTGDDIRCAVRKALHRAQGSTTFELSMLETYLKGLLKPAPLQTP